MKKTILILSLILIISIIINIFLIKEISSLKSQISNFTPKNTITQELKKECKTNIEKFNVNWVSMQPLIKDRQVIEVEEKYYECWKNLTRWDIVDVSISPWDSMIKKLLWLPWDIITSNDSWNLVINWEILINSAKEKYVFEKEQIDRIMSFVVEWKLRKDVALIFWDNITNSIDSRTFWPIDLHALKWKVIKY